MANKVWKAINTLAEINANFQAWNLGYFKKYMEDLPEQIEVLGGDAYEAILIQVTNELEMNWNSYILGQESGLTEALSTVIGIVEQPFTRILNRVLKVQT